jgi:predicted Zn-dependent protease
MHRFRRHRARGVPRTLLLLLLLLLPLGTGCLEQDPLTGRSRLALVPAGQLRAMSEQEYDKLLRQSTLSDDAEAVAMVRRVGERIRRGTEAYLAERGLQHRIADFNWAFNLIESEEVNAFCMPGGKVAVYTGMLPVAKSEAGLAVVMGHEIAHAVLEHGREQMSRQLLVQFGGLALGRALAERGERARGAFLGIYGAAASLGFLLPHSRQQEHEADRLGLFFTARGGYDPRAAIGFWRRLRAAKEGRMPVFLSTHPADEERIRRLQRLMPRALEQYRGPALPAGEGAAAAGRPLPFARAAGAADSGALALERENARLEQVLGPR